MSRSGHVGQLSRRAITRRVWEFAALTVLVANLAAAQSPAAPSSIAEFALAEGLAALHSFEYEDANEAFLRAERADPSLVLAYWGEAMTYHQTLWGKEDVSAARGALAKLALTAPARAAAARSLRERMFLDAADALFGPGDGAMRRARHAGKMAELYAAEPYDPEVASFYALALLGTMSRSLIGYVDPHEGHSASLAGSDTQARVGAILGKTLAAYPEHPGALHYLLHNYDDPEHARLGLDAARAYATAAPASSHALHMPAHIFLQLGMWADAEASDRAAFSASAAWVARKGLPPALRSYHALAWRQYELQQMGRFRESWALLDELSPVVKATGDLTLLSDLSSMRARHVIETQRWAMMANERNFGNVNELCAIGISAARSGNPSLAELARQGLAGRATSPQEGDLRPAIAIMEREVAAVIALAAGQTSEAVEILKSATRDELQLPPPLGLPIPVVPAPELLGEVLLQLGRPAEALEAFRQALSRNANRTRSVLGSARAAAAMGQTGTARDHYRRLLANYEQADADLVEVAEARAAQAATWTATSRARTTPLPLIPIAAAVGGVVALLALALGVRRSRAMRAARPTPTTAAPGTKRRRR